MPTWLPCPFPGFILSPQLRRPFYPVRSSATGVDAANFLIFMCAAAVLNTRFRESFGTLYLHFSPWCPARAISLLEFYSSFAAVFRFS